MSRAAVTPVLLACLGAVVTVMYALPSARAEAPLAADEQWAAVTVSSTGGTTIGLLWLAMGLLAAAAGAACLLMARHRLGH